MGIAEGGFPVRSLPFGKGMTKNKRFYGEFYVRLLRRNVNYYYVGIVDESGNTLSLHLFPHDFGGWVKQQYLPYELNGKEFYHPSGNMLSFWKRSVLPRLRVPVQIPR